MPNGIGAALITGLLIITVLLHFYTKISVVLLFWLAFILTRPFGATFGDLITKPIEKGGLDFGTIGASLFFAVILAFSLIQEMKLESARRKKLFS